MYKIREFNPDIYPIKLWVSFGKFSQVAELFWTGNGNTAPIVPDFYGASTHMVRRRQSPQYYGVLIHFENNATASLDNIAHEATHAVDFIWNHIGETEPGAEATAYLVGWMVRCINKAKKDKDGTLNHQ